MSFEHPVTVADRYASAANTSNLRVKETFCDADLLLAAGIAASKNREKSVALAVYRVGVTGDRSGLPAIVDELADWLIVSRQRVIPKAARRALVMSVLVWWFEPACRYCNGHGFAAIENTSSLGTEECGACHGSGRRPLAREVPQAHAARAQWLAAKLDQLVAGIHGDMARLLKDRMEQR